MREGQPDFRSDKNRYDRNIIMEIELAEAIVCACEKSGIKAVLKEDYKPSWMRGQKTVGVVIISGDLAQVITAIIANPHLFINDNSPKFCLKNNLLVSTFQINQIIY